MTATRLQDAALARFAKQGFDATSLAEIAGDVGIKKPSIYAHFRNKDELYMSLIPTLIASELAHAAEAMPGGGDALAQFHAYLLGIRVRYESSHHVEFWLKTLAAPPRHLYDVVMGPMHDFMNSLEAILRASFTGMPANPASTRPPLTPDTLASAAMGMIDALQSELIYGGTAKYERRLDAMWQVFTRALEA